MGALHPPVHLSLACFPNLSPEQAMALAQHAAEPAWGPLSVRHVQLVPQSAGVLSAARCQALASSWPATAFRLHANVRHLAVHRLADLSNYGEEIVWWQEASRINQLLGSPDYSAHAGRRRHATLDQMFDNARRAADLFGSPVAVEGMYPNKGNEFLVSCWSEYRSLLDAKVPYALDLSHLNIVAVTERSVDLGLVRALVGSPRCIEIHVSGNDGHGDQHQQLDQLPWWEQVLPHTNQDAVWFTEGVVQRSAKLMAAPADLAESCVRGG